MAKPLLFSYSRDFNLGRLRVQNVLDEQLFGFGIRRTYYQPAGGGVDVKYVPGTGKISSIGYAGEMRQDAPSPWNWFPQVGAEGPYLEYMDWCITADLVSPAWIDRAFGKKMKAEDFERQQTMPYQLTQPGDLNWNIFGQSPNRRLPSGKVVMLTYYQIPAPRRGHERGLEIRICGTHVLDVSPLQTCPEEPPFKAQLPFTIYAAEPRRGTFYPRPPGSDWVECQMRINQTLSHQYTYAGIASGPNLLTTKGDHVPKTVGFGFEKWEIPQGFDDPRWLIAPQIPPWLFEMKGQASEALDRVSMNFGATRGERSAQDPSGHYLDVLREHDQIDLQMTLRDHARSHEQDGEMLLRLAKKYEKPERMLEVVGANGKPQLHRFIRDKLHPEKVRVYVQSTSILPYLATSRQRSMMEMVERGVFGPPGQLEPATRRKLLNWVNLPGLFELDDVDSDDVRLAERNHSLIIDEGMATIPSAPDQEGIDPAQFQEAAEAALASGKAFQIDPDWDPNELIPLAISRKKEDDAREWPVEIRKEFEHYIACLKQLQTMQQQVAEEAATAQTEKAMALEVKLDAAKQENQAKGRAKVKLIEQAAKASMAPDPEDETKQEIVKEFAKGAIQAALAPPAEEAKGEK